MDTKVKSENIKLYIELLIIAVSFIGFLIRYISFTSFLIVALNTIFIAVILYRNWNYPDYKEKNSAFSSFCEKFRFVFIIGAILISCIALFLNIAQSKVPPYQDKFMAYHFTTPKEINELKPPKVLISSINKKDTIAIEKPKVVIANDKSTYLFNNEKLLEEMIKYSSQYFNSYGLGIIFLFTILLVLFILADMFIVVVGSKNSE